MVYAFARLCHFQLVPQFVKQNKNIRSNAITMEVDEARHLGTLSSKSEI